MKKKFTLLLLPLALIACDEPSADTTKEPTAKTAPNAEKVEPLADSTKATEPIATNEPSMDKNQSVLSKEPTKEEKELVYNFCYALQATAECDNLSMRLDTEAKIQEKVQVSEIRSSDSAFGDICTQGISDALKDKNICKVAWEKYGCAGSVTPRLLQENPFNNPNAVVCQF